MKLREQRDIWPPTWLPMSGSHEKKLPDDSATLIKVALSRIEPVTICYLTTRLEDETYTGTLVCRDADHCRTIFKKLAESIGKPIRDIEELDLSQ